MQKSMKKSEPKVDEAVEESFPASDPPSYMGSSVAGAPKDKDATGEDANVGEVTKPVQTRQISVDLNKATADELGGLTALSPELVRALIGSRPYASWDDVEKVSEIDADTMAALKKGGAFIGY